MVQMKYLVALAPFALLAYADDQNASTDSHDVNAANSQTITEQGGYFGGCGLARRDQKFGNNAGGGNVQGNSCRRSENVEAQLEARDLELGFDALDILHARDDQTASSDSHDINAPGASASQLKAIAALAGLHARDDQTAVSDSHDINAPGASAAQLQAIAALEKLQARDNQVASSDSHDINAPGASAAQLQAIAALANLKARDDQTSSSDSHDINAPTTTTGAYGGGYFGGCARSMFGLEERSQTFGDNAGGGNVQGNHCRRSDELAIRDIGAVYRRHLARSYSTEDEAAEAADMLRRHAEHLGML